MFQVVQLDSSLDQILDIFDRTFDGSGDLVDILRLHDSLQVVLEHLGEIVCAHFIRDQVRISKARGTRTLQLRTTEVLEDLLPVGRVLIASQVWFQLATENLQSCTLSNTVCSNETKNLTGTGHGESVELEAVGGVPVGNFGIQVGRQVDDVDSTERTFLGTDTTTNAKAFRDKGNLGLGSHFDTELAGTDHGARLFALLTTFLQK